MNSSKIVDVEKFVDSDIFTLIGLSGLSDEEKSALKAKMLQTIENRVNLRLLEELEQKQLLEAVSDAADEEAAVKFFSEHAIPVEAIIIEEAVRYKAELKTAADMVSMGLTIKDDDNPEG
ncbi:MAG: hypothetical protein AAB360_01570 [Patescibacteria group bacterium]